MLPSNLKKEVSVPKNSTVHQVLKKMNIKPDTVLVLIDKKPVPIDDVIGDTQELEILQVASGG
ncbi:MAG: MoaD/ThiS family protein [Candidatus Thermoplasmatota archaeon]